MSYLVLSCPYEVRASNSASIWTQPIYGLKNQATLETSAFDNVATAEGWVKRESDLKAIRRYRDDWDGMGACAPPPHLVDAAILMLKRMRQNGGLSTPPSAVSGTPMGRITLEWRFDHGYLEAELIDQDHIEWMRESEGEVNEWSQTIYDWPTQSGSADSVFGSEFKDRMWPSSSISVLDFEPSHLS